MSSIFIVANEHQFVRIVCCGARPLRHAPHDKMTSPWMSKAVLVFRKILRTPEKNVEIWAENNQILQLKNCFDAIFLWNAWRPGKRGSGGCLVLSCALLPRGWPHLGKAHVGAGREPRRQLRLPHKRRQLHPPRGKDRKSWDEGEGGHVLHRPRPASAEVHRERDPRGRLSGAGVRCCFVEVSFVVGWSSNSLVPFSGEVSPKPFFTADTLWSSFSSGGQKS